jgi:CrcB protein
MIAGPNRPVDPDVDLGVPAQRLELRHHQPLVLAAIAVGGVLGAEARYGLARAVPHGPGSWPWSTLAVNVVGSLLIGILMSVLAGRAVTWELARPFLGTGVLGGFTTFSTYAVDLRTLAVHGEPGLALTYAAGTVVACLLAVTAGAGVTRAVLGSRVAAG